MFEYTSSHLQSPRSDSFRVSKLHAILFFSGFLEWYLNGSVVPLSVRPYRFGLSPPFGWIFVQDGASTPGLGLDHSSEGMDSFPSEFLVPRDSTHLSRCHLFFSFYGKSLSPHHNLTTIWKEGSWSWSWDCSRPSSFVLRVIRLGFPLATIDPTHHHPSATIYHPLLSPTSTPHFNPL